MKFNGAIVIPPASELRRELDQKLSEVSNLRQLMKLAGLAERAGLVPPSREPDSLRMPINGSDVDDHRGGAA